MRMPSRREQFGLVVGALIFSAAVLVRGEGPLLVGWFALIGAVTGAAVVIDVEQRRIPNTITYSGTLVAVSMAVLIGMPGVVSALAGALIGGGMTSVAVLVGGGGLGLGDAKFSAFAGAVLGLAGVVPYLVLSTSAGVLVGIYLLSTGHGRRATFPFGPSLAAGLLIALVWRGSVLG